MGPFFMNIFEYNYSGQLIQYELKRTSRKTLGVYIYPDRRVQLRVPRKVQLCVIEQYLNKSAPWVLKQLEQLPSESINSAPRFIDGGQHYFCGKVYTLRVRQGRPQRVDWVDDCLYLYSLDVCDEQRSASVLKSWYKQQAQILFKQRLECCWRQLAQFDLTEPSLRLRWMKSRWGSCSTKAVITLNLELIKYPEDCLDYVVMHELCHLREFNHSPKFYTMMDQAMPDWRSKKAALEALKL